MATTVLIVDDHAAFRSSARRMLQRDGFEVVGEAVDARTAITLARWLDPDVVLLDVALPDGSGFDVADELRPARSEVVLISSRTRADLGPRVDAGGVRGFIPKDELSSDAVRALLRDSS